MLMASTVSQYGCSRRAEAEQMTLSALVACRCVQCCVDELSDALSESMLHRHLPDWPASNDVACHYQHDYTGPMHLFAVATACMAF